MNYLLKRTFENRGYPADFFQTINQQTHGVPKDTDKLCAILKYYHDTQDLIVLLTDFDTDGICCGIEGFAGLAELGFNVALFIPDTTEGYGFHPDTIDRLVAQYPNVKAILTADVGATCYAGVNRARELGIDMLVTDHHIPKGYLNANVFVDPSRKDDSSAYAGICGASVLYQVLLYYAENYATSYLVSQIKRLSVFAGCGTVSDSMPLYFENRQLVQDTLNIFKFVYSDGTQALVNHIQGCAIYRRAFLGLFTLLHVFKENGNAVLNASPLEIHEDFIGYYLAPALNSIKRMGADIQLVYGVFFGPNPVQDMQAILDLNDERKRLVEEKFADIVDGRFVQPWAPYIYVTDAAAGLRGLLAQRVMELTGEPVMVVGSNPDGTYSGSGRCPSWYPFLDVAGGYAEWYAAGHNPAFGVGFDDESGGDSLFAFLKKSVPTLKPAAEELVFQPDFVISMFNDGDAGFDLNLLEEYLGELEYCRPFGEGFPEPTCLLKINSSLVEYSVMGKEKNHLKIHLPMGMTAVCFYQADVIKEHGVEVKPDKDDEAHMYPYWISLDLPDCLELVGKFSYNNYNGSRTIQFMGDIVTEID